MCLSKLGVITHKKNIIYHLCILIPVLSIMSIYAQITGGYLPHCGLPICYILHLRNSKKAEFSKLQLGNYHNLCKK